MASVVSQLLGLVTRAISFVLHPIWLKLWPPLQVVYLFCRRDVLRRNNLVQPVTLPDASAIREGDTPADTRTFEGSGNNLQRPTMGMSCPFSRNTPPRPAGSAAEGPDPALVSSKLLARPGGKTKTKPLVNLLGGAWLQFMVHDWFEVQKNKKADPIRFTRPDGGPMLLQPATVSADETGVNNHDHWWSGVQIYGTTPAANRALRTGVDGKLKLNAGGSYLALDANGVELVGFNLNLWGGLQLLHYVFAKEHNCVCDMLKAHHPDWDDDKLHSCARKIITALIARLHTVEWTTAIVQHPTARFSQYMLWYGLFGIMLGRKLLRLTQLLRPLGSLGALLVGLSGGPTVLANDQPLAHSEEFVLVYRMHALLPDKIDVKDVNDGNTTQTISLDDVLFKRGTAVNTSMPLGDLFTTLGMGHAGALELRNYPTPLLNLQTPFLAQQGAADGQQYRLDMGVVDVWRSREARVPLYNDYRKAFSLPAFKSFDKLSPDDDEARAALREVYNDDPNQIDVMVGLLAEAQLPGFIFSESIYTVFLLQTQRRTESDRFLTQDYTEEVYTREGMRWVEETTMSTILRRHVPALSKWLAPNDNAFIPWDNGFKRQLHEKVLWDLLLPGRVYRWLKSVGYDW